MPSRYDLGMRYDIAPPLLQTDRTERYWTAWKSDELGFTQTVTHTLYIPSEIHVLIQLVPWSGLVRHPWATSDLSPLIISPFFLFRPTRRGDGWGRLLLTAEKGEKSSRKS
jgi:hypothetical protein